MLVKEFRIPMPLTLDEFRRGQLYSVSEASKNETGGGEGAEFVKQCEFFDDPTITEGKTLSGIYSYKIYRMRSRMPWILKKTSAASDLEACDEKLDMLGRINLQKRIVFQILPLEAFEIHEESWNAFPYCKTILTNPGYMGSNAMLVIESMHLPDNGSTENPLNLNKKREIILLDICNDAIIGEANYKPELDPKIFKSKRTGRGQLKEQEWIKTTKPMMCCYKAVSVQFKWLGFGNIVEKTILKQYTKIFANFHRNAFCWIDTWYDLTDEELQEFDEETARQLQELFHNKERRGVIFED